MSLTEHLDQDHWQEFLVNSFEYALHVLEVDRYRSVGSEVDDLRSWLASGGVPRVKERLSGQMESRKFPDGRVEAVNE